MYGFYANAMAEAPFETVSNGEVWTRTEELAARPIRYPSVRRQLDRRGSVFIAGRKSAGGISFQIRKVD